ncbi:MAG: calcium-binding protein [Pseudomonadota bacterium]
MGLRDAGTGMPYSGSGNYSITQLGGGLVNIDAGIDGTGTLTVTGGSYQIGNSLAVGLSQTAADPLTGLLRFDGSMVGFAPLAGQASSIVVGQSDQGSGAGGQPLAYGYLDLLGGATLDIDFAPAGDGSNAPRLVVGDKTGAFGQVLVAGSGSSLTVTGANTASEIGRDGGQGALALIGGATGAMTGLTAGAGGGIGQVYLTGSGSELTLSAAYGGGTSGPIGGAVFGQAGGAGFLGITGGAKLTVRPGSAGPAPSLTFGADGGSYGYGILSGAGSQIIFENTGSDPQDRPLLTIADAGRGVLHLDNGAEVLLDGSGARVEIGASEQGDGTLQLLDGSSLRVTGAQSSVLIAPGAQTAGVMQLSGAGTTLAAGALLTIGAGVDIAALEAGAPDPVEGTGGGAATLDLGAGTVATATTAVLGASGQITGTGTLDAALEAYGHLSPGGDGAIGALAITGALVLEDSVVLAFDIGSFASAGADRIMLSGALSGPITAGMLDLSIDPGALGDLFSTVTLIETMDSVSPVDTSFAADGAVLRLFLEAGVGLQLRLIGLEVAGTPGDDTLTGSLGDDRFLASAGADAIDGGTGRDLVDFSSSTAVTVNLFRGLNLGGFAEGDSFASIEDLLGGDSADRFTGTESANGLSGGGGDDRLSGRAGDDTLSGGEGEDMLFGGNGADDLDGGADSDRIEGGSGADQLDGGAAGDLLRGGAGEDTLRGGEGDDRLDGGSGGDQLFGGAGSDTVEGGAGDDSLFGGSGSDSLYGQGGADMLSGDDGADLIDGGAGFDVLIGGAGADTLVGGAGTDRFVFADAADAPVSGQGRETIVDFRNGADILDLSAFDADPAMSGRQPLNFIDSASFSGQTGEVRVEGGADPEVATVEIDIDGDTLADLIIDLLGAPSLGASDFEL